MIRTTYNIIFVCILLLAQIQKTEAQEKDSTTIDTTMVLSGIANYLHVYNTKWLTLGAQHDLINRTYGLVISNGFDERPLFHFEDLTEDLLFKILGHTDFNKSYFFAGDIALQYPIREISLVSIGYEQFRLAQKQLYGQYLHLSTMKYIGKKDFGLILSFGYRNLNDSKNIGADLGLEKVLLYNKLYTKASVGYYRDYFVYSGTIEGYFYNHLVGLSLNYDRIDNNNFLKLGIILTVNR